MLLFISIKLGFLTISLWDILDILIVGYLIYQIYRLLRGSIAFNIFIGVLMLYVVWWLVTKLKMGLLSAVLDQFVSVGVIILIIIFQPEVRRFLLFLGDSTLRQRSNFFGRVFESNLKFGEQREVPINALKAALQNMSKGKVGALIVLAKNLSLEGLITVGVTLDANISESLIESIFFKDSPLHDGAIIISGGKIQAASCILPLSENTSLPRSAGSRHRAAVGITEKADVSALIVSEESGSISFAHDGKLQRRISEKKLIEVLEAHF